MKKRGNLLAKEGDLLREVIHKISQCIVQARVHHPEGKYADVQAKTHWFELEMCVIPQVKMMVDEAICWEHGVPVDQVTVKIDIHLTAEKLKDHILLERWNITFRPSNNPNPRSDKRFLHNLYKQFCVLVRTLQCRLLLLPAQELVHAFNSDFGKNAESPFAIYYTIYDNNSQNDPHFDSTPSNHSFRNLETSVGEILVAVFYRKDAFFEFARTRPVNIHPHVIQNYIPESSPRDTGAKRSFSLPMKNNEPSSQFRLDPSKPVQKTPPRDQRMDSSPLFLPSKTSFMNFMQSSIDKISPILTGRSLRDSPEHAWLKDGKKNYSDPTAGESPIYKMTRERKGSLPLEPSRRLPEHKKPRKSSPILTLPLSAPLTYNSPSFTDHTGEVKRLPSLSLDSLKQTPPFQGLSGEIQVRGSATSSLTTSRSRDSKQEFENLLRRVRQTVDQFGPIESLGKKETPRSPDYEFFSMADDPNDSNEGLFQMSPPTDAASLMGSFVRECNAPVRLDLFGQKPPTFEELRRELSDLQGKQRKNQEMVDLYGRSTKYGRSLNKFVSS